MPFSLAVVPPTERGASEGGGTGRGGAAAAVGGRGDPSLRGLFGD
jgi:hypothetical protein